MGKKPSDVSRLLSLLQWEIITEEETAISKRLRVFFPIFYFKRRDTNLNLHQEYLDTDLTPIPRFQEGQEGIHWSSATASCCSQKCCSDAQWKNNECTLKKLSKYSLFTFKVEHAWILFHASNTIVNWSHYKRNVISVGYEQGFQARFPSDRRHLSCFVTKCFIL